MPLELYNDLPGLLRARETQSRKCKVFTCGKIDCDRVRQQLLVHQAKMLLKRYISAKDAAAIKDLLSSSRYLVLDYTREHLVNEVLDGSFATPLRLAESTGDADVVMELLAAGAKPERNFWGDYPWEFPGFPPLSRAWISLGSKTFCAFDLFAFACARIKRANMCACMHVRGRSLSDPFQVVCEKNSTHADTKSKLNRCFRCIRFTSCFHMVYIGLT